ncbi:tetratricopeptide repeat protein [Aquimarina macrocephali]|uniref:tetratricopeptide repeat protein n=1 Tax=Aquimarina macrocephali TaxID=666563 RepID=UPI0004654B37|nr:tetratricopeptide repeat protein [Aquimarina macrocephali]
MFENFTSKNFEFKSLAIILIVTLLVYLNHFDNPFFFDDYHTITENESIRNLDNWTSFFSNADTFSSLPANRSYRPVITLMNAIDYSLANGLNPKYYHYHIFFWFLVLIILMFQLTKHIYVKSMEKYRWIGVTALFATAWFALHTANAETINYICARSDSFSTLCVVASLLLYIHPIGKKWHLYLLTMIIGIWTKQTGVIFLPILFVYVLLFEEYSLIDEFKTKTKEKIFRALKKIAPTAIIGTSLFLFNQYYLTPEGTVSTNYTVTRFEYISTQCYVIIHYLGNFILPINLSADPDITIIKPWYDIKILAGILIILGTLFLMIKTSFKKELRPISFGIAWFFIALLPTSLNPLFQTANDHRMFFPFIGLFIAVPWGILIILKKYNVFEKGKNYIIGIASILLILLIGHTYGTFHRNKIWNSEESLWLDVTMKSPKNGRGQMNYGLTQMEKGKFDVALEYFNKADKLIPKYYILYINLGVAHGAKKEYSTAEHYFKSAIHLNSSSPAPEYYYGRYLSEQKKYNEAEIYLKKALIKSPNHILSKQLLKHIANKVVTSEKEIKPLLEKIKTNPDIESYINLSLIYYRNEKYELVISTCKEVLKIDPNNVAAYNNICSAYNQMKQWKLGAEACKKALEIDPKHQLAKNNLKWATDNIN